jgi:hypothetical protein
LQKIAEGDFFEFYTSTLINPEIERAKVETMKHSVTDKKRRLKAGFFF